MKKYLYTFLVLGFLGCKPAPETPKLRVERVEPTKPLKYEIYKIDTLVTNDIQEVTISLYPTENIENTIAIQRMFDALLVEYKRKGQINNDRDSTAYVFVLYPSKRIAYYEGTDLAKHYFEEEYNKYIYRIDQTALNGYWMDIKKELSEYDKKFKALDLKLNGRSTKACTVYFEYLELRRQIESNLTAEDGSSDKTMLSWEGDQQLKSNLAEKYDMREAEIASIISYSSVRCR